MAGAGRVGQLHTKNIYGALGGSAGVVGVIDPNVTFSEELASQYGIPARFDTIEEALAQVDCDGVVITTPTFTHRSIAVAALEAGKHVHLEKPMAMNLAECRDIEAAARSTGASVQLGFMRRFDEEFQLAANSVQAGELGVPMIISSRTHGPGLPPKWAYTLSQSNGMLAEVNSHDLDTVSWFAGAPAVSIQVTVANKKGESLGIDDPQFYDTLVASIVFANGALASVTGICPCDYGYDSRAEIIGTRGGVTVGSLRGSSVSQWLNSGRSVERPIVQSWRNRFAGAYVNEMKEFLAVMNGATPRVGVAEGAAAVELVLAGTMSLLEGRRVDVSEVRVNDFQPSWQVSA